MSANNTVTKKVTLVLRWDTIAAIDAMATGRKGGSIGMTRGQVIDLLVQLLKKQGGAV